MPMQGSESIDYSVLLLAGATFAFSRSLLFDSRNCCWRSAITSELFSRLAFDPISTVSCFELPQAARENKDKTMNKCFMNPPMLNCILSLRSFAQPKAFLNVVRLVIVGLLILGQSHFVSAAEQQQVNEKDAPGSFFEDLTAVADVLKSKTNGALTDSLLNAGFTIGGQSVSWAVGIAGSLALIYLISQCLDLLSGEARSAMQVIFNVGMPAAFCAYMLINYQTLIQDFAGKSGFLSYIRNLGGDPMSSIVTMYGVIFEMVSKTIGQACVVFLKALSAFNIGTAIMAFLDALCTIFFAIGILGLSVMGLTDLIGLVLLGPFLSAIAIAFGPVFIAGFVTPWTREYFSKWLAFLVASAVVTGVLGVCCSVVANLFAGFNFTNIAGDDIPSAAGMLIVAIVLMSINSLIQQVPQIASAMVPGSIGASKGAGAAVREGGRSVSDKAKSTAGSAKNIYSAAKAKSGGGGKSSSSSSSSSSPSSSGGSTGASTAAKYPSLNLG